MSKSIQRARALYPGTVSLPSFTFPEDEGRKLDALRYSEAGAAGVGPEIGGTDGASRIEGGAGANMPSDHNDIWANGMALGHDPAKLPYDLGSLATADANPTYSKSSMEPDVGGLLRDRASKNVTYPLRIWPVPGEGRPAQVKTFGPNGHAYADGRYSPAGRFRTNNDGTRKPHYGVDLPAKIGSDVVAADEGVVRASGVAPGWGDYVAIDHADGTVGLYAHLDPKGRPGAGTRVQRGEGIGSVGGTGNAASQGDHLHYEVRREMGAKTLGLIANGGVSEDPTIWMRERRISRNRD